MGKIKSYTAFLSVALLTAGTLLAQNTPGKEAPATAEVKVVVTDFKLSPLKAQDVVFTNVTRHQKQVVRTDAAGKGALTLQAGATYAIQLKTMTDTINYSTLEIPALHTGEYFQAPFTVNIKYEPAKTFTLNNVHFDTGKPTLRPDSFKELNEISEFMKLKDDEQYEISGHTDNVGNDDDNLKLSQQRADAVKAYLVKKGIAAGRLTAKGYGATRPVADNNTPEGRQKNRRTEVSIVNGE